MRSHILSNHRQDFDDLLSKYAMAEVTIDQLRLGAKLNLYSDHPQPALAAVVQPGMFSYVQTNHEAMSVVSQGSLGIRNSYIGLNCIGRICRVFFKENYL